MQANDGLTALIYNYGEDPVNSLLLAAVWENLDEPGTARPYWKKLTENPQAEPSIRSFATDRMKAIDNNEKPSGPWKIMALGRFPQLDWSFDLFRHHSGLMSKSPAIVDFALKPDTRHWEKVPAAVYITRIESFTSVNSSSNTEECWQTLPNSLQAMAYEVAAPQVVQ